MQRKKRQTWSAEAGCVLPLLLGDPPHTLPRPVNGKTRQNKEKTAHKKDKISIQDEITTIILLVSTREIIVDQDETKTLNKGCNEK